MKRTNSFMFPKKKIAIMLALGLGLTMVTGMGLLHFRNESIWSTYQEALKQEQDLYNKMAENAEKLEELIKDEKTCLSQVSDPAICKMAIDVIAESKTEKMTKAVYKPNGFSRLSLNMDKIRTATDKLHNHMSVLSTLNEDALDIAETLKKSYLEKATANYKNVTNNAKSIIVSLTTLIRDSEGKVTDDATRQEATKAIQHARTVVDSQIDKNDITALRDTTSKLVELTKALHDKQQAISNSQLSYERSQVTQTKEVKTGKKAKAVNQGTRAIQNRMSGKEGNSIHGKGGNRKKKITHTPRVTPKGYFTIEGYEFNIPKEDRSKPVKEGFIPYG
ncbi:hypothetical protein AB1I62_03930 [Enterococcus sp. AN402]|uniref:hypothetical protein n=1 Tax=Enterococcus sp. AN402 TaxID=3151386 RepID=UPI00345A18DC